MKEKSIFILFEEFRGETYASYAEVVTRNNEINLLKHWRDQVYLVHAGEKVKNKRFTVNHAKSMLIDEKHVLHEVYCLQFRHEGSYFIYP